MDSDSTRTADEDRPVRVLLVEDNDDDAFFIEDLLEDGLDVAGSDAEPVSLTRCETLEAARAAAADCDVVLLDLSLPDSSGIGTFTGVREAAPGVPIVVLSGRDEGSLGVDCVRQGAEDYLSKNTVDGATVSRALRYALLRHQRPRKPRGESADGSQSLEAASEGVHFEGMLSAAPVMRSVFEVCERVASTAATVLLLGETGTGKELIARAIHARSGRSGKFVALNCGAVPEALIEAELFGHEKGAFTGATAAKPGLFRRAEGGTLLLDEVADLSASAQVSLLRTLQEQTVRPVGGGAEVPVDVRVLAATSGNLFQAVERGEFRSDLLYRLDVIRVEVPALRERPEDVLHLLGHFLREQSARHGLDAPELSAAFLGAAADFPWPGNVRQLQNVAERIVLTSPECITGRQFQELVRPYRPASVRGKADSSGGSLSEDDLAVTYDAFMDNVEKLYFEELLRRSSGRVQEGATLADISRRTLLRKMKKHRLEKDEFR